MSNITVVQINTFPYKATGAIMLNIHHALLDESCNSYVVWGRGRKPENENEFSIEDSFGIKWHGVYSRFFDKTGFASKKATERLLSKLNEINPDIVHIHNIHGYYLNIEMLFQWLKAHHVKVVWTLHDCWPFTGHCAYFDGCGCEKWKTGCYDCEQLKTYPASLLIDNSKWNWQKKKELFTGLDITLVTPCEWLKGIVKQSFLGEYPVEVINNGIDLSIFKPTESSFREKYGFQDKIIILGVASEWTERKGMRDFIRLEEMLCNRDKYKIVLVGLTEKQKHSLPDSILGITRTNNVQELVQIYSAADMLFNPTYEDNYPTTNLEAIACGTPIITYKTGGSPESVNERAGVVFDKGAVEEVAQWITIHGEKKLGFEIMERDRAEFDKNLMIRKYLELYRGIRCDGE